MESFFDERIIEKRLEELENKQPVKYLPAVIPNVDYYMGVDPGFKAEKPAIAVCHRNKSGEIVWDFMSTINRREYKTKLQELTEHFKPVVTYEEHSQ